MKAIFQNAATPSQQPPLQALRTIKALAAAGLRMQEDPLVIVIDGATTELYTGYPTGRKVVKIDYYDEIPDEEATMVPQGPDEEPARAWVAEQAEERADPWILAFAVEQVVSEA